MANFLDNLRKKRHYNRSLNNLWKKVWDAEFLRNQLRKTHEGFRLQRDRVKEHIDAVQNRLKMELEKPDPDKTIKDNLQADIERQTPDLKQLEEQMTYMDTSIEGKGGTNEQIKGLRGVIGLLEDYINEL